jgi:hypothetical protein
MQERTEPVEIKVSRPIRTVLLIAVGALILMSITVSVVALIISLEVLGSMFGAAGAD